MHQPANIAHRVLGFCSPIRDIHSLNNQKTRIRYTQDLVIGYPEHDDRGRLVFFAVPERASDFRFRNPQPSAASIFAKDSARFPILHEPIEHYLNRRNEVFPDYRRHGLLDSLAYLTSLHSTASPHQYCSACLSKSQSWHSSLSIRHSVYVITEFAVAN